MTLFTSIKTETHERRLMFSRYTREQVETLLKSQPKGNNTRFLLKAHDLWQHFGGNYERHPPFALEIDNKPVALVFVTFSARSGYANLYEIATLQGMERKGYATKAFWLTMTKAREAGMQRLKMSCTPDSVTWHKRNGAIFWGVDSSGSLRCDMPILDGSREQLKFRALAIKNPYFAFPELKVMRRLKNDSIDAHQFSLKKKEKIQQAISDAGECWLRDELLRFVDA